jgi:2,3-bisphosphoglycerate-independent phosphoglycerate mutase
MKFLFIFVDGVGLGTNDPQINPLAQASMPTLEALLAGKPLVIETLATLNEVKIVNPMQPLKVKSNVSRFQSLVNTAQASLLALDSCLGVPGLPQSATGQATLLTGVNVPAALGYHYGPKPNQAVARFLETGTLFHQMRASNREVSLLNAYPPTYFRAIESGYRLLSAIPLAMTKAGIPLKTIDDLFADKGLSADFTGQGWRDRLGIADTPLLTPEQAGERMAILASQSDLSFFEYWLSDYAGHKQIMDAACNLLEAFDRVLSGLLSAWDMENGLILITSDHGNLEDLSTRRHTRNPVPALIIGSPQLRQTFTQNLVDLTSITPAILNLFT